MCASEHCLYEDIEIIESQNFGSHNLRDAFLGIEGTSNSSQLQQLDFGKNVKTHKLNEKAASRLERRREQNRKAAAKLRLKKHKKYERLIMSAKIEEDIYIQLQSEVKQLSKACSETARVLQIHQKQCPFIKASNFEDFNYH